MKKNFALISAVVLFLTALISNSFQPVPETFSVETSKTTTFSVKKKNPPTVKNTDITISFIGDCMLASYCGETAKGNMNYCLKNYDTSYFFKNCSPYISTDDFTIANCENVISDRNLTKCSKNYSPAYWYRGPVRAASVFANSSIDAVSLSNNHSNDYGSEGLKDTKNALEKAGVKWGNSEQYIIFEKNGIKIGIICHGFWGEYHVAPIVNKIKELSKITDIQIVLFHGGTERVHTPEQWKKNGCHKFVDAGADLVLGGHPHVLQPYEEYKGVSIVYSLGNFCYGGSKGPENRTILYQHTFSIDKNKKITNSVETIIPFYVYTGNSNNWQPTPITNQKEKQAVLNFMYGKTNSPF